MHAAGIMLEDVMQAGLPAGCCAWLVQQMQ
jgi:hypothetical protein